MPTGTVVTFVESDIQVDGYSLTVNGTATTTDTATATATSTEGEVTTASFVNTYTLGQLTINKDFAGNAANDLTVKQKETLEFTVKGIEGTATAGYNETFKYGVNDADRNATWSGNELTIKELKLGNYTVSESGDTFTDAAGNAYIHSVEMKVGEAVTEIVEATVDGSRIDITNTYEKAKLDITKVITVNAGTLANMTIKFKVEGPDNYSKDVTMSYPTDFEDGPKTITLTQKDGILPNTEYTVTEIATGVNVDGYTRKTTVSSVAVAFEDEEKDPAGKITVNDAGEAAITFTNAYTQETTEIEVEKTWVNADGSTTWPDGVTVTVRIDRRRKGSAG